MSTTPSRGRPRAFDVDRVLEHALELFWRGGYRGTSTRELEAALGVNQSSLYNTFGSKAALLTAALDRYEGRIDAELVAPLEASDAGLDAIDAFFIALHRWVTHDGKRGCMVINLMAEDGGDDATITRRTRRYRRRVRRALHGALQRAVIRGETTSEALDERTELLFGMVLALNIVVRGGASSGEVGRILTSVRQQIASWRTERLHRPPARSIESG